MSETTRFVDVGANIGFFTLAVAQRAAQGKVWSIEPDPQNVRLLRANVMLNGLEGRVEVHHAAASDAAGEVFFSTLGYDRHIGSRFTAKDAATLRALRDARYTFAIVEDDSALTLMGRDVDRVLARPAAGGHHVDLMLIPEERGAPNPAPVRG